MADLLELSARIIDSGHADQPVNRTTNELSEVADGLAMVESFSHSVVVDTGDGLIAFDASGAHTGRQVRDAITSWRDQPVRHLVYTHGHADHVGGSTFFADDHPVVIGHQNVAKRIDRYAFTNNWNLIINARQFGGVSRDLNLQVGGDDAVGVRVEPRPDARRFLPARTLRPDREVGTFDRVHAGGHEIELHHARGETDDHLWAFFPERKWIMTGDFLIWNFPNAGNPQKVQRYPGEWAAALRKMLALEPELLLPAHGLAVAGRERVATVLGDLATALERLVADVVAGMNAGATLDEIVHAVRVDDDLIHRPWLRPIYDEPEFVVRNTYRLYGGWWDGDPAHLKPPPAAALAVELAELAGGADVLAARAQACSEAGDHRMACQLVELAAQASEDPGIWRLRSRLYLARADHESSLMAKGVYTEAARAGDERAADLDP
mgnify:CR=1 FL=1